MKYRREIDGLRAAAVLPVILFHAGFTIFSGGYVGVDVFFVISGFLITSILIDELERGDFSILRFYERRARRILPALFTVILTCLPSSYLWMLPSELKEFSQSIVSVVFFISNIDFWRESNYFSASSELKPLLHTWSLAVEEQYYLFFPIFLFLVWKFGRSRAFWSVLAIAAISLALSEWGWRNTPVANFYLAPTRAWELLAGSICAFLAHGKPRKSSNLLSASGLAMIVFSVFVYGDGTPFPSVYALMPVAGTALILLFATQGTLVARLLSMAPFAGIGVISYSAYLWHQPLFAFARLRGLAVSNQYFMAALAIASLLLAWVTWRWVERPFRAKARPVPSTRNGVFATSAVVGAIFLAIGLTGYLGNGFPLREVGEVKLSDFDGRLSPNRGLHDDCDGEFKETPNCSTSSTPNVLLWGDSYAMHLAQGILASKPDIALQQHTISACAPVLGVAQIRITMGHEWSLKCIDFNNRVLDWLKRNKSVNLVILSSPFHQLLEGTLILENGRELQGNTLEYVTQKLRETIDEIRRTGADVLVVSPTPLSGYDIGQCVIRNSVFDGNEANCNFTLDTDTKPYALLRAVSDHLPIYWLHEDICKADVCDAVQDGNFIYRDTRHLSKEGSAYLGAKHDWMRKFRLIADGIYVDS